MLPAKVSVVGLGYVGLPVAVAFGKYRQVIAFDVNASRLEELLLGYDRTGEISTEELQQADLLLTENPADLRQASIHIIAVPTPITHAKQPDLTLLLKATETVGKILKAGDLVIYESTVYPGCTEEDCAPLLEKVSGLKYLKGTDIGSTGSNGFTLGYSPERINPGDKQHTFTTIRKVVSGSTPVALEQAADLYSSVVTAGVHRASSIKVAEAAKVIENAQRDLNIAFVNELAMIFDRLNIDTREVLEAAGTKWNFLPFQPGLVGGHCIGVDPYYLTHRAERTGYHPQVILAGRRINDEMGVFIARRTVQELAKVGIGAVGARVLVLGLTFKEDCPDLRNSKVPDIIEELTKYGCEVLVHDPYCDPKEAQAKYRLELVKNLETMGKVPAILMAVAHQYYRDWDISKWQKQLDKKGVVIDVKAIAPKEAWNKTQILWRL
ncbi:MAG: nucleotide sugar dehydrogenase [Deltaproteobacteria bacterium]|nr:nucleotide sugar dehydrogenase [Deltaproteobacteria bacterium]